MKGQEEDANVWICDAHSRRERSGILSQSVGGQPGLPVDKASAITKDSGSGHAVNETIIKM